MGKLKSAFPPANERCGHDADGFPKSRPATHSRPINESWELRQRFPQGGFADGPVKMPDRIAANFSHRYFDRTRAGRLKPGQHELSIAQDANIKSLARPGRQSNA